MPRRRQSRPQSRPQSLHTWNQQNQPRDYISATSLWIYLELDIGYLAILRFILHRRRILRLISYIITRIFLRL